MAVGEFDGVFDALASVLFANLFGLFLDESRERIDAAGDIFAGFFLGRDQRVVETFDLLAFSLIDAVQSEVRSRNRVRYRLRRPQPGSLHRPDDAACALLRRHALLGLKASASCGRR